MSSNSCGVLSNWDVYLYLAVWLDYSYLCTCAGTVVTASVIDDSLIAAHPGTQTRWLYPFLNFIYYLFINIYLFVYLNLLY